MVNIFFRIDSAFFLRLERAFQEEKSVSPDLSPSPPHPPPKVPPARKLLSTYKSGRNMPRGPPAAKFCYKTTPLLLIAYPIEYRFLPLLRCVCSCHHEHLTPDGCLSLCRQDFEAHTAAKVLNMIAHTYERLPYQCELYGILRVELGMEMK